MTALPLLLPWGLLPSPLRPTPQLLPLLLLDKLIRPLPPSPLLPSPRLLCPMLQHVGVHAAMLVLQREGVVAHHSVAGVERSGVKEGLVQHKSCSTTKKIRPTSNGCNRTKLPPHHHPHLLPTPPRSRLHLHPSPHPL